MIDCGVPPKLPDSIRYFGSTTWNSSSIYECLSGKRFERDVTTKEVICGINGKWNNGLVIGECKSKIL